MIRQCETCGNDFRTWQCHLDKGNGRFCSLKCKGVGMRKPDDQKKPGTYRTIYDANHPLVTARGSVSEHRMVLYEKIGSGSHQCHWCSKIISWMPGNANRPGSLIADHLSGDKGDNRPENLVPSCHGCNIHRDRRVSPEELHVTNSKGKKDRAEVRNCAECSVKFTTPLWSKRKYCSTGCSTAVGRRTRWTR